MSRKQNLEWGYIDWLYEPSENSRDNIRVGISTVLPNTTQPRHFHYGDEQLMYVISGHGKQRIGDEESVIEPGKVFHISTGMAHESLNDGQEPIVKLLVSVPALAEMPNIKTMEGMPLVTEGIQKKSEFLRRTVQQLSQSMLAPLKLPVVIFDPSYEPVYCSDAFPDYCRNCCGIQEGIAHCEVLLNHPSWVPPYYEGISACVCPHGLWVCTLPVVSKGELLGFIRSGFVRTVALPATEGGGLPYQVPESTVQGIMQITQKLAKTIANYYEMNLLQAELQQNLQELSNRKNAETMLQESLRTSQDQVLNLQINQHFLFNTLNTIAGMSIREGATQTYTAIGELAQLFRYTLCTHSYFVTLSEELDYLKNYLDLQKMRFGNKLCVMKEVPLELLNLQVPFNFLQPVVENCFKHAFANSREHMEIRISVERTANRLLFRIADNGCGMAAEQLEELREKLRTGNSQHGSTMVMRKLESLYGTGAEYTVASGETGTAVTIGIPISEGG